MALKFFNCKKTKFNHILSNICLQIIYVIQIRKLYKFYTCNQTNFENRYSSKCHCRNKIIYNLILLFRYFSIWILIIFSCKNLKIVYLNFKNWDMFLLRLFHNRVSNKYVYIPQRTGKLPTKIYTSQQDQKSQ